MKSRKESGIPKSMVLVIFGATGDLTHRKIIPSMFLLYKKKSLPEFFHIIAYARREKTDLQYRQEIFDSISVFLQLKKDEDRKLFREFLEKIHYHQFDFLEREGYSELKKELANLKHERMIYYPATSFIDTIEIVDCLKAEGLVNKASIAVEKPFGNDLATARKLNKSLHEAFPEDRIFRIDHYLGKESVQNIIAVKFANVFERLLSNEIVDHVQIIADESIGVSKRGGYYDRTGALKDMMQNHMLQLLSLIAMNIPKTLSSDDIKREKNKVLRSLRMFTRKEILKNAVLGQYGSGIIDGTRVAAYRDEERVGTGSRTETFVALKCFIDNKRWRDVPFYLRTGKRLGKKVTKLAVVFKENKGIFSRSEKNFLIIDIYPEEGIKFQVNIKKEGKFETFPMSLAFCQQEQIRFQMQEAYQKLLHDMLVQDHLLFSDKPEIELMWRFIDSIAKNLDRESSRISSYEAGSDGPLEADQMIERDGRKWMI